MKFGKIDGCGFGVKLVSFDRILNKGLLIYIYLKILNFFGTIAKRGRKRKQKNQARG
jgi:hypothetical protein